jgi:DNA (cytosine-5)-methyltransferase 1
VLKHHYPQVPNFGDMTKFKEWNLDSNVDVFVGGTPCQSFSVAGLRKGLDDPRGNLMLTYLAIADKYRPKWLVWENVAGVLSSNGGKDFGTFLGGLGELRYGFAYRILDAQYFGVAQRRRRVFVVGCLGDWRSAAAVLFERYSLSGNTAPSREKGKSSSKYAQRGIAECSPTIGCELSKQVNNQMIGNAESFFIPEVQPSYGIPGNWIGRKPENGGNATEPMYDIAPCLTQADQHGVAQPVAFSGQMSNPQTDIDMTQTLQAKNPMAVAQAMAVRRLTPVECERLQGFPDNYTDIKPKNKTTPDGPRYKALGNSMAVPVMAWIGKRIQEVENIKCKPNK